MKRPRKPPPPPSRVPWNCVICAVDPGDRSGVSIWVRGRLLEWGTADNPAEVWTWCERAYRLAEHHNIPLVFALETWKAKGKWSGAAMLGMGESPGRWKDKVKELPRRRPTTKVVRIQRDDWAKCIYGFCRGPHKKYDWKQKAIETARQRHPEITGVLDHNAAESIHIGECATLAGIVGAQPGVTI